MNRAQPPVLIQQCDAPAYLGVKRSTFMRHVKPKLTPTRLGGGVFYLRVDLDQFFLESRGGCERPEHEDQGDSLWELARKRRACSSEETFGISTNKSGGKELERRLEQAMKGKQNES